MLSLMFTDDEPEEDRKIEIIDADQFPAQEKSMCPLCGSELEVSYKVKYGHLTFQLQADDLVDLNVPTFFVGKLEEGEVACPACKYVSPITPLMFPFVVGVTIS